MCVAEKGAVVTWLRVVSSHTRTHIYARTCTCLWHKQRRPVHCLCTYTCLLHKQGMHVVMLPVALVVPFARPNFIQPSCFACSALANSRACDFTQMCFAATRSLWSRLRLVVFFRSWRVGARFVLVPVCGVCQWCLVLQNCVLRMVVVL